MLIETLTRSINDFSTAIEAVEVLIKEHDQYFLKPTLVHLMSERAKNLKQLSTVQAGLKAQNDLDNTIHNI